ncbi:MAG: SDR family oxidoreductase, partial [Planctomycetes bacterium]|nr:SDR family oxidoreductase [Planctomycetota bacterium]
MSTLLTGATGFVGAQVLLRLLKSQPHRVVCLVRAESPAHAARRGRDTLQTIFGLRARRYANRVDWIPADLEQESLGLSERTFRELALETEEIFHCAASTSFELSYADAKAINVTGLKRVYALAEAAQKTGNFRRLNHVSTAYVTGEEQGTLSADFLPGPEGSFRNTYEETKAEAERFLRDEGRVPYCVFRPSIVVGDSLSGQTTNWNVVYYPMRLMADGKLPFVPSIGPALVDCVPVDWVADAMVALARRDDVTGRTFNLTAGSQALTVSDVVEHTYAGLARRDARRRAACGHDRHPGTVQGRRGA